MLTSVFVKTDVNIFTLTLVLNVKINFPKTNVNRKPMLTWVSLTSFFAKTDVNIASLTLVF